MDKRARDELLAKLFAQSHELLALARHERDLADDTDQDLIGFLDKVIPQLEDIDAALRDVEIVAAIRRVLARHGPGPYPDGDLAEMVGYDLDSVKRVLHGLEEAGPVRQRFDEDQDL